MNKDPRPPSKAGGDSAFRAGFLVSPAYDLFFFILSPLTALGLGAFFSTQPSVSAHVLMRFGRPESLLAAFSSIFTMAHLFLVFFRSHLNIEVFSRHRFRFVVAPVLVFGAMALSSWVLVFGFVLAAWWDVYHSSLQTFGLGRLYDQKAGRSIAENRRMERALNLLMYAGPILGGVTFADHAVHLEKFREVGSPAVADTLLWLEPQRGALRMIVLAVSGAFAVLLLLRARSLRAWPWQKSLLYLSTGVVSLWAWGFNSFGEAFFIMNFFHALQYFAIVWWIEKGRLRKRFGPFAASALLGLGFGYGIWATFQGELNHYAFSALLTVSLLHFWYDGFIWSVTRGHVRA